MSLEKVKQINLMTINSGRDRTGRLAPCPPLRISSSTSSRHLGTRSSHNLHTSCKLG